MRAANRKPKIFYLLPAAVLGLLLFASYYVIGCGEKYRNLQATAAKKIISDSLAWSVRMADSEIFRRKDSLEFGGSDPKAKWNYQTGLFLKSLLDVGKLKKDRRTSTEKH